MVLKIGDITILVVARMQTARACSSGEAEYYALASTGAEALFTQQLFRFLGLDLEVIIFTDSNAARGIGGRSGVGPVRSLETKLLWLQDKIRDGALTVRRIDGERNVADLGTKILTQQKLIKFAAEAGLVRFDGERVIALC